MASTRDHAKANPTACMVAPSRIASTSPSNSEATSDMAKAGRLKKEKGESA